MKIFYVNKHTNEHGKRAGRTNDGCVIITSPTIKMGGRTNIRANDLRKHWRRVTLEENNK